MLTRCALVVLTSCFAGTVWGNTPKCFGANELIADAVSKTEATAIAENAGSNVYVRNYAFKAVPNGGQTEWVITQNEGLYSVWIMPSHRCANNTKN